jgi:hypothetical protein
MQQHAAETAAELLVSEALGFASKHSPSSSRLQATGSSSSSDSSTKIATFAGAAETTCRLAPLADVLPSSASSAQLLPPAERLAVDASVNRAAAVALGVLGCMLKDSSDGGASCVSDMQQLLGDIPSAAIALCQEEATEAAAAAAAAAGLLARQQFGVNSRFNAHFVRCLKERVGGSVEKHVEQRQQLLHQARQLQEQPLQQLAQLLHCLGGSGSSSSSSSSSWKPPAAAGDSPRVRLQQLLLWKQCQDTAVAAGSSTAAEKAEAVCSSLPADVAALLKDAATSAAAAHSAHIAAWQLVLAVKPSAARALHTLQLPEACRSQANLEAAVQQWPPDAVAAAASQLQQQQCNRHKTKSNIIRPSRSSSDSSQAGLTTPTPAAAVPASESAACCICGKPGTCFNAYVLPTSLAHAVAARQLLGCCTPDPTMAACAAAGGSQMLASAVCSAPGCVAAVLAGLAAAGPPQFGWEEGLPLQQWQVLLQLVKTDLLQLKPERR